MNRRHALTATACVSGAALLVTSGILISGVKSDEASAETTRQSVTTAAGLVEKGDLRGTTTKPGTLGRTPGTAVPGGPTGTVTQVPEVGSTVKPRDVLYRVDDLPVTYFSGTLPQWRPFESGMPDGPDVKQLETNLHDWGYLAESATEHFDWLTRAAIQKWQKDSGQTQTGMIEQGRIWFGTGTQVVSEIHADVGSATGPGTGMYSTRGTTKVVTVDLPVGSPLAEKGGVAEVRLPGSATARATVSEIGDPATDDQGKTTVPVTLRFDEPDAAKELDQVEVSVDFVSDTRKDVLSVPVTALGASADGGFVVEVISRDGTTKRAPITVGLFAGERVEVTGGAVRAGDKIVVPA